MRRRLIVSMLGVIVVTVVLSTIGGVYLIRRDARQSSIAQLQKAANVLANHPATLVSSVRRSRLGLIKAVAGYSSLEIIVLSGSGAIEVAGIVPLTSADAAALNDGTSVAGSTGKQVFVAIPLELTRRQSSVLAPAAAEGLTPVLVASRAIATPATGFGFFALVGIVALLVSALVALWLADRFTRPLSEVVAVTSRLADGELTARRTANGSDLPEISSLTAAVNEMAERLERARDQQRHFLLSVSHDLRTPLTSIAGYAEAIADGAATDTVAAAGVISAEAERLTRLVGDLLDLARLDAQHFSLRLAQVDVGDVIDKSIERFASEADNLHIALVAQLPTEAVYAQADSDRLAQVITNLIENALRFARQRLDVRLAAAGGWISIDVVDDGVGIRPGDRAKVFEPHYTADSGRSRHHGTGLGLAIVSELVALMGGSVEVFSPIGPDGGTAFRVTLPV